MSTQAPSRIASVAPPSSIAGGAKVWPARIQLADKPEEHLLLEQARRGDTRAFDSLIHLHKHQMYRTALRITEHHQDAEEAMQEAALSAYRNLEQFQGHAQLRTWLTRIAINHALMICRKRKTGRVVPLAFEIEGSESAHDPADMRADPEQSCYRSEMGQRLQMAIERLSPTLRSAFILRHIEELTPAEAAEVLGISVPAFKSRLMRARKTLRRRLTYAVEPAAGRCRDS